MFKGVRIDKDGAGCQVVLTDLDPVRLDLMTREIALAEAIPTAAELLAGQVRGRLVVDVNR